MTRGELETLIAAYMHRTDLGPYIPGFIELAGQRIGRTLRSQANETVVELGITEPNTALPDDYRGMRSVLSKQDRGPRVLSAMSPTQLARYTSNGTPAFYCIQGKTITVQPFTAGVIILDYWAEPAALPATTSTNAVLTAYPYLYLYAALVEASVFVDDTEKAGNMAGVFNNEITEVNNQGSDAMSGAIPVIGAA